MTQRRLGYNKVCELEDFADADLAKTIRDVFRHEINSRPEGFPNRSEYRKLWEIAMSVRALRDHGALRPDADILGVGAGTEVTSFYLANQVGRVFATDLYQDAGVWEDSAHHSMMSKPHMFAPYPYRTNRLFVQNMNALDLQYPDNTFDGIFSSGSIEHFGNWDQIATAASEMGRVLKPGGILTLSTEFLLKGPPHGSGWDGLRFFDDAAVHTYIIEASGLETVDTFASQISDKTWETEYRLRLYEADVHAQIQKYGEYPRVNEVIWSHYPHIVMQHEHYTFSSVHLTLRKASGARANQRTAHSTIDKREHSLAAPEIVKRRIGIDISVLQTRAVNRGMGKYTTQQINAIIASEPQSEFYLFHRPTETGWVPPGITMGSQVQLVELSFPEAALLDDSHVYSDDEELAYTHKLHRFLEPYELDLFHLTCWDMHALYMPRRWHGCPLVITVYDLIPFHNPSAYLSSAITRNRYQQGVELLKQADTLIAISSTTALDVEKSLEIPMRRLSIAPPYADQRFGKPADAESVLRQLQISDDYVFSITDLHPEKNVLNLLKAFAALPLTERKKLKLVIVSLFTADEVPDDYKETVKNLGLGSQVIWLTGLEDDEIVALYQGALAYIHVALVEGFGMPALEAMQCGTPLIVSNRGALAEVAEGAGLPVSPEDYISIADGIRQVIGSPELRRQLSESGTDRAKHYSASRMMVGTQAAYDLALLSDGHDAEIGSDRKGVYQQTTGVVVSNPSWQLPGVNLITDLLSDTGLSESYRQTTRALRVARVPLAYHEFIVDPRSRTAEFDLPQSGNQHDINLILMNAPEFLWLRRERGQELLNGKYNIGYWYFELPEYPENWIEATRYLDEIWVATQYVQSNLQKVSYAPVRLIPPPLDIGVSAKSDRSRFNLPVDAFTFMFSFNTYSSVARKNPFGVIEAFKRAFKDAHASVCLVVKSTYLNRFPKSKEAMLKAIQGIRCVLIEDTLSRDEMYSLIASCDSYISLHRAEGFGLGMAEAIWMGKPVIGTGWSGNVDFMKPDHSYLVSYKLVEVAKEHHQYQVGTHEEIYVPGSSHWAEPDIEHAAAIMQQVYSNPEEARWRGQRAQEFMRTHYSTTAIARRLEDHLRQFSGLVAEGGASGPLHVSGLTRSQLEKRNTAMFRPELERQTRKLKADFHDWNVIRNYDTRRQRLAQMRGIGFLMKTLVRIRNLGRIWAADYEFRKALLAQNDSLVANLREMGQEIERLRALEATLDNSLNVSAGSQLSALEAKVAELGTSLEWAQVRELEARISTAEALETQLREVVGQIRLLQHQLNVVRGTDPTGASRPDTQLLLSIVHDLEDKYPELRRAATVELEVSPQSADSLLFALAEHFGERINPLRPTNAAYVVLLDGAADEVRFDVEGRNLTPGAHLVLITTAQAPPDIAGMRLLDSTAVTSPEGISLSVTVWQRV